MASEASDPIYKAIGGDAVLRPSPMDLPIKSIEWKHNEDIAADWHGNKSKCFGQFKGRCEVDTDTGALTIKGLKLNDSGIYTPEINYKVPFKIELSVISRVAKSSVKTSCNTEMTSCLLTCEGNTTNADPVVYKWFLDGKHGSSYKEWNITKDTKGDRFSCLMMNPVSNETSESIINPFIKKLYGAKGEDVILRPPPMNDTIQRIEWKHNENIAAGWYGNKSECLGQFEAASTHQRLTSETPARLISVISRVAKPSVKTSCNTEMTSCNLTCEGNTAEAEPITYRWFIDGRDGPSNVVLIIAKDTKGDRFSCLMMNQVSNETSESVTNPFIKQLYGAKGEDVILRPPPMNDTIQRTEWKHNENIAAGWYGNKSECLGQFEGRCEVNTDTGALTIKELNLNNSGIYTPEINFRDSSKTHLSVISRVAKPSVKTSCNTEMTSCDLTCEGNTTEAEPITYTWFIDGRDGPSNVVLIITKDTKEESFRCLMMNPVSNDTSESVTNPFIKDPNNKQTVLVYGAKGEDVIIRPPPMNDTIQRIEWKHNESIAAGWYGDEFECLNQFEGRCEVNTKTGALTIKGLKQTDNGIYTLKISGKVTNKTELSVISRVAKPSVVKSCNPDMTSCNLTCEGNTAEAEPVTYTWFIDGRDGPSNVVLIITKDSKEYSFRCLMMNPVSNETSESIKNPIITKEEQDRLISILVPVIVVVVLVVIVVAAVFIYNHIRGRRQGPNNRRDVEREEGHEHEMDPLNQTPDDLAAEGHPKDNQHLSNGAVASGAQRTSLVSDLPSNTKWPRWSSALICSGS
ncbi:carcinoembryonic antigen-related cell adhesion molecule 5-like [Cheilinus undulatus]|uniref:carcinoembryonic antigen-related cell adhesion molecule 5-like n=1 Tax=Cheilinus undulatus TaxID=241271 RepID=UPI001BD3735A|nr:carcinoembryonic antigen-related cell adhesion molecule 5-like [Cheilinus undulatus]